MQYMYQRVQRALKPIRLQKFVSQNYVWNEILDVYSICNMQCAVTTIFIGLEDTELE